MPYIRLFTYCITASFFLIASSIHAQTLYDKAPGTISLSVSETSTTDFTSVANNFTLHKNEGKLEIRFKLDTYISGSTNLMDELDASGARLVEVVVQSDKLKEIKEKDGITIGTAYIKLLGMEYQGLGIIDINEVKDDVYTITVNIQPIRIKNTNKDGWKILMMQFEKVVLKPMNSTKP